MELTMKYNKNNIYSGINIYNKLDKDIQEIIDNYLIQMRREELILEEEDLSSTLINDENFKYRRFMTEFNLHYKFNNSIMKSIVENDMIYKNSNFEEKQTCSSISEIMFEYFIVAYYCCENIDDLIEIITDKLIESIDYIISKMFMNDRHNMDIFENICKKINRIPLEVINSVIEYQDNQIGELDISTSNKLDFAKISCWFINEYLRLEIYNFVEEGYIN
tara:strand:+ start:321 stop:980 length:660 start_codon:yes stop_codon:yes gene_type:complete